MKCWLSPILIFYLVEWLYTSRFIIFIKTFFCFICVNDYDNNMKKHLDGPGQICEIGESMYGKCKLGKGNSNKQSRQYTSSFIF